METMKDLLIECKLQLEYLNEKFGETGTTNALLAKIEAVINKPENQIQPEVKFHPCENCHTVRMCKAAKTCYIKWKS